MATRKPIPKRRLYCTAHERSPCDICNSVCEICDTPDDCAVGKSHCSLTGEFMYGPNKGKKVQETKADSLDAGIFKDWADHVPDDPEEYLEEEES